MLYAKCRSVRGRCGAAKSWRIENLDQREAMHMKGPDSISMRGGVSFTESRCLNKGPGLGESFEVKNLKNVAEGSCLARILNITNQILI